MLDKLLDLIPDKRSRNLAFAVTGMGAVLTGQKVVGLGLFGKGVKGLEECWREAHPEFQGGLVERWELAVEHYDATHRDPTNRKFHTVGIPVILAGTAGLLVFPAYRPLWALSATAFVSGWALNIAGHVLHEGNAPAFADDPLSLVAGPVWELTQLRKRRSDDADETGEGEVVNMPSDGAVA
ncbi:MAG: DUF962 domain-containing protein [Deltaproteobacteria bacterium]|nr:DUF962 domain-containing protein [Deltaproteobacteria bacterium]